MRTTVAMIVVSIACSAAADERVAATSAGELRYGKNETSGMCLITLARKMLAQFDCTDAFLPELIFKSSQLGTEQGQILVFQENPMGNACNGGPLHVIGIGADGKTATPPSIDFCGGKAPVFSEKKDVLLITLPGGSRNHGEGKTVDEAWRWSQGKLIKVK